MNKRFLVIYSSEESYLVKKHLSALSDTQDKLSLIQGSLINYDLGVVSLIPHIIFMIRYDRMRFIDSCRSMDLLAILSGVHDILFCMQRKLSVTCISGKLYLVKCTKQSLIQAISPTAQWFRMWCLKFCCVHTLFSYPRGGYRGTVSGFPYYIHSQFTMM